MILSSMMELCAFWTFYTSLSLHFLFPQLLCTYLGFDHCVVSCEFVIYCPWILLSILFNFYPTLQHPWFQVKIQFRLTLMHDAVDESLVLEESLDLIMAANYFAWCAHSRGNLLTLMAEYEEGEEEISNQSAPRTPPVYRIWALAISRFQRHSSGSSWKRRCDVLVVLDCDQQFLRWGCHLKPGQQNLLLFCSNWDLWHSEVYLSKMTTHTNHEVLSKKMEIGAKNDVIEKSKNLQAKQETLSNRKPKTVNTFFPSSSTHTHHASHLKNPLWPHMYEFHMRFNRVSIVLWHTYKLQ